MNASNAMTIASQAVISAQNALKLAEATNDEALKATATEILEQAKALSTAAQEKHKSALEAKKKFEEEEKAKQDAIEKANQEAKDAVEAVEIKVEEASTKAGEIKELPDIGSEEYGATIDANIANAQEAIKLADEAIALEEGAKAKINALQNEEDKIKLLEELEKAIKEAQTIKADAEKSLNQSTKAKADKEQADKENEAKAKAEEEAGKAIDEADKVATEAMELAEKAVKEAETAKTSKDIGDIESAKFDADKASKKSESAIESAEKAIKLAEATSNEELKNKAKATLEKAEEAMKKSKVAKAKALEAENEKQNGYGNGGNGGNGGYGNGGNGGNGGYGNGGNGQPGQGGNGGNGYGGGGTTIINNYYGNGQPGQGGNGQPGQGGNGQPGQGGNGGNTTINNNGININGNNNNVTIIIVNGKYESLTGQTPGIVTQDPVEELPPVVIPRKPRVTQPKKPLISEEIAKNSTEQNIENLIVSLLKENNELRTGNNLKTESLINELNWGKILENSKILKLKPAESAKVKATIEQYIKNMTLEESRKLFAETSKKTSQRRSNGEGYTRQTAKFLAGLDQAEIDKAITAKNQERDTIYAQNKECMQAFNQIFPNIDFYQFVSKTMASKTFHEQTKGHSTPDLLSRGESFKWKLVIKQMYKSNPNVKKALENQTISEEQIEIESQNLSNAIRTILKNMSLEDAKKIYKMSAIDPNAMTTSQTPTQKTDDGTPKLDEGQQEIIEGEVTETLPETPKKTKEQYQQEALARAQNSSIMDNVKEFVRSILNSKYCQGKGNGNEKGSQNLIHDIAWKEAIEEVFQKENKTKFSPEQIEKLAKYAEKYVSSMTLEEARELTSDESRTTKIDQSAIATHLVSDNVKEDSFRKAINRRNNKLTPGNDKEYDMFIDDALSELLHHYNNLQVDSKQPTISLLNKDAIDWTKATEYLEIKGKDVDIEVLKKKIEERIKMMTLEDAKKIQQNSSTPVGREM